MAELAPIHLTATWNAEGAEELGSYFHEILSALDSLAFAAPEMYGLHLGRIKGAADDGLVYLAELAGEKTATLIPTVVDDG